MNKKDRIKNIAGMAGWWLAFSITVYMFFAYAAMEANPLAFSFATRIFFGAGLILSGIVGTVVYFVRQETR